MFLISSIRFDDSAQKQWTPLHVAAHFNRPVVIDALVDAGADYDAIDINGSTPIYYACYNGCLDAAKKLASRGANPNIPNTKVSGKERGDEFDCLLCHAHN